MVNNWGLGTGVSFKITLHNPKLEATKVIKRVCQHPSNKFEILWQVAQNSFSLLLSYFVAQCVLIIVV